MEDAVARFRALTIAHPRLLAADSALRELLDAGTDLGLVLLFGPTGVGKSTLLTRIGRDWRQAGDDPDPAAVPVCLVRAHAPETAAFNWRDFYADVLRQLAHPAPDETRASPAYVDDPQPTKRRERASVADMRRALDLSLHHRRTGVLLVDEAPHLATAGSGRRIAQQLDVLKSLADATGVTVVLAGTYELLRFRHLNAQLSRRCQEVHLARYDAASAEDLAAWRSVVATFAAHLPESAIDLTRRWEELYEGSLGCVGVLKPWLTKALTQAVSRGESLRVTHLRATAMPTATLRVMAQAALEGEARVAASDDEVTRLRALLALPAAAAPASPVPQRRRPGERRPVRDPVAAA